MSGAKRQRDAESELHELRAAERRMQRELGQHRREKSAMVLRSALLERETADLRQQIHDLRQALSPSHSHMTTLLLDPAVNAEIMRLREEVKEAQKKESEAQDALQASQFQQGSIAGKKLIQKCKELQVRQCGRLNAHALHAHIGHHPAFFRRRMSNWARICPRGACRSCVGTRHCKVTTRLS